jgi:protein SCO1/2
MKGLRSLPYLKHVAAQRRRLHFNRFAWSGVVVIMAALAAAYWFYRHETVRPPDPPGVQSVMPPEKLPTFSLVDQHGVGFTRTQLLGKWTIMFFGYTHCPDFCPTTLSALNSAIHRLEREDTHLAANTQVVFVSVDPFRDSPPVLADFINHFNPNFIGATGPPAQLHLLTDALGASYDYADPVSGDPIGDTMQQPQQKYTVDHGSGFYIFDDHARTVAWVLPPHTTDRIVSVYKTIRKHYE